MCVCVKSFILVCFFPLFLFSIIDKSLLLTLQITEIHEIPISELNCIEEKQSNYQ